MKDLKKQFRGVWIDIMGKDRLLEEIFIGPMDLILMIQVTRL